MRIICPGTSQPRKRLWPRADQLPHAPHLQLRQLHSSGLNARCMAIGSNMLVAIKIICRLSICRYHRLCRCCCTLQLGPPGTVAAGMGLARVAAAEFAQEQAGVNVHTLYDDRLAVTDALRGPKSSQSGQGRCRTVVHGCVLRAFWRKAGGLGARRARAAKVSAVWRSLCLVGNRCIPLLKLA